MVDTGAVCLSLPAEFFDTLMAYIPSHNCTAIPKTYYEQANRQCFVTAEEAAALPFFSFQLSEKGTPLHIPLSALLVPPPVAGGSTAYCVVRSTSIEDLTSRLVAGSTRTSFDSQAMNLTNHRISFGTMVLESLYAAFDLDEGRVGLAQRHNRFFPGPSAGANSGGGGRRRAFGNSGGSTSATGTTTGGGGGNFGHQAGGDSTMGWERCKPKARCRVDDQQWVPESNTCMDIGCTPYYLQWRDPATRQCVWAASFKAILFVLLALFVSSELLLQGGRVRIARQIARLVSRRGTGPRPGTGAGAGGAGAGARGAGSPPRLNGRGFLSAQIGHYRSQVLHDDVAGGGGGAVDGREGGAGGALGQEGSSNGLLRSRRVLQEGVIVGGGRGGSDDDDDI